MKSTLRIFLLSLLATATATAARVDVLVYGATPAGVCAAIGAARDAGDADGGRRADSHGEGLASVKRDWVRIAEITTVKGDTFAAKTFVDTTYEGDLSAHEHESSQRHGSPSRTNEGGRERICVRSGKSRTLGMLLRLPFPFFVPPPADGFGGGKLGWRLANRTKSGLIVVRDSARIAHRKNIACKGTGRLVVM